jgi:CopA family copper-resistance protein
MVGVDALVPAWARAARPGAARGVLRGAPGGMLGGVARGVPGVLDGSAGPLDLVVGETRVPIGERQGRAITVNGTLPGPVLRYREGDDAIIRVTNRLDEDTSVHWHGILLPNEMDGVPGVTFPGIPPGTTFEYRYPLRQYGTYWYHSHSGFQEQLGQYGALVIDPAAPEPFAYDREHVVVLSDWTFEDPGRVMARLTKRPDYYNLRKRTIADFVRDASDRGLGGAIGDRLMWGGMRMNPTDISDVTGATYTYLVNGLPPEEGWTGLFELGERVRLRIINASAASFFDVRVPGLTMTVVQAMGQHVRPVETEEIRIAVAETYDVIVEPAADRAYTIFAEAMDRSGYARGTLAPREGMEAPMPARRPRPVLTMADMGMDHGAEHGSTEERAGHEGHAAPAGEATDAAEHAGHARPAPAATVGVGAPPGSIPEPATHGPDDHGAGNASVAALARSRLGEPGLGLGEDGWQVLRYTDLVSLDAPRHLEPPTREIELHLTGNMERFMWSIDGRAFDHDHPIAVRRGERIRFTLVNDTMMNHPMHLHGMWMELENGRGAGIPRVHTVNVKPAERLSFLVTADAPGPWPFHCHILYHMDAGMFRIVEVSEPAADDDHEGHGGQG